ncbi:hypothetical protein QE152_g13803 [Popillia japonica]|uniref:Uncharacterized protein n=1 Tax=Popillia japonica TaxID=7064 RepID=A0AAW1LBA7_POPJA
MDNLLLANKIPAIPDTYMEEPYFDSTTNDYLPAFDSDDWTSYEIFNLIWRIICVIPNIIIPEENILQQFTLLSKIKEKEERNVIKGYHVYFSLKHGLEYNVKYLRNLRRRCSHCAIHFGGFQQFQHTT